MPLLTSSLTNFLESDWKGVLPHQVPVLACGHPGRETLTSSGRVGNQPVSVCLGESCWRISKSSAAFLKVKGTGGRLQIKTTIGPGQEASE